MNHGAQLERLKAFSDAVFAIAITLLVIEVHVPRLDTLDDAAYLAALAHLVPSFMGFALSFLTIGALWVAHHRLFGVLEGYEPTLMWPNMLLLMVIAFMPFATALMSSNPLARVPEVFYSATLLAAGLLQLLLFRLALKPGRTRPAHRLAHAGQQQLLPAVDPAACARLCRAWPASRAAASRHAGDILIG